ncbi:acetylcholinesterase-like [Anoplophora glabripennis]|uniref:acetylcholinesterase-like n=1 Tax=Anoplophora glabripennis TaxID=217634 RepID=UPI000C75FCA2|nr:acetylcholinesterase-like [Anoplophora glabripennis]
MMKCNGLLILILYAIRSSVADVDDPTLVTLPKGQIRGQTLQSPNDNAFYAFQEIPYAAPPIGELRFQAPVAPAKWEGILNTTKNEKICYQSGAVHVPLPGLNPTEDCLYLNVYTPLKPGDTSQTPLPVLIWIHGFLTTEDGVIPGNLGLKDQHFAIQWVKNNIDLFGGDPEKITISGESAGGASVGLQLVSQRNKGLFRGAILQSGTSMSQWAHQDYARFYAFELARSLVPSFTSDNSTELLQLLQSLPASDINDNSVTAAVGKESELMEGQGLIWLPVIEDASLDGALLTGLFHEDIRTGNINQIPIIIGFNSEEALFFLKSDPSEVEARAKYFDSDLSNLIRNKFNMTKENKLTVGSRLRQIYTDGTFEEDPGQVVKFYSDESFITASIRHAKLQSNYTDVYMYQFSYQGNMGGMKDLEIAGVRGVGHAEELCYLWDAHLSYGSPNGSPYGFPYGSPYGYPYVSPDDSEDVKTRHRLLTLWSNFVKYLNPTPEVDSLMGNVTWEKVSPNNLVYLNINDTLEMQTNPRDYLKRERIIDVYAIPPLVNY